MIGNLHGQAMALKVVDVQQSKCEQLEQGCRLQKRIVSQTLIGDTLSTNIGIRSNCGGICEVEAFVNKDTLKIYYHEGTINRDTISDTVILITKSIARCKCCFEFNFKTKGLSEIPTVTTINDSIFNYYPNKYKLFKVNFDLLNKDTVNYTDLYGRKQGKWLKQEDDSDYINLDSNTYIAYYRDNYLKSSIYKEFYKNGVLKLEYKVNNFNEQNETEYYENGDVKNQYISFGQGSTVSYDFYTNQQIERISYETQGFKETTTFYENGGIKSIKSKLINKDFYSTGMLKKEIFGNNAPNHINAKYYYDNGLPMAIKTIKPHKGKPIVKWKCYDKQGNRVPREALIKRGFKLLEENSVYLYF
ncbi:MAG: hypothetical protein PSX81_15335 [bacterium]|nr:hypothetical protein [bacterium]